MISCKQCEFLNPDEARYCQKCGLPLEETLPDEKESSEGKAAVMEEAVETDQPVPRKRIRIWLPVTVVCMILVAAVTVVFAMQNEAGPLKTAKKFMEALDKRDAKAVIKMSVCPDFELTEEKLEPMLDLYASDESFKSDLAELLKEDVERIKKGKRPNTGDTVNLYEEGGFPFKKYKIRLSGSGVRIETNLTGAEISFEGGSRKLGSEENKGAITDLLPGIYHFNGSWKDDRNGDTLTAEAADEKVIGYGNTVDIRFPYTTLQLYLPSELVPEKILIGEKESAFTENKADSSYSVFPVIGDTEITLMLKNQWGTKTEETFRIPADYKEESYDYQSTIKTASLFLTWSSGFTIKEITINGKTADLESIQSNSITIPGVLPGEQVVTKATDALGEEIENTFTVEDTNGGMMYYDWQPEMKEAFRDEVARAAGEFYQKVLTAYSDKDLDTLEELAGNYQNIFAATFLEMYKMKEELDYYYMYIPKRIVVDKSQIQKSDGQFSVLVCGECDCIMYSKNEKTGKWKKEDSIPATIAGIFTVTYNEESGQWLVTGGEMGVGDIEDITEPLEIPIK